MTIDDYYDWRIRNISDPEVADALAWHLDIIKEKEKRYTVPNVKYIRAIDLFGIRMVDKEDLDPIERWCEIEEAPGYYISESGLIWSSKTHIFKKIWMKSKSDSVIGRYPSTTIKHYGTFRIHRLLAKYFIPNPNNFPIVRHLNDDPEDWFLDNLEWGTYQDNMNDRIRNGKPVYHSDEERKRRSEARKRKTKVIYSDGNSKIFNSRHDAAIATGMSLGTLTKLINKIKNEFKGYRIEAVYE